MESKFDNRCISNIDNNYDPRVAFIAKCLELSGGYLWALQEAYKIVNG